MGLGRNARSIFVYQLNLRAGSVYDTEAYFDLESAPPTVTLSTPRQPEEEKHASHPSARYQINLDMVSYSPLEYANLVFDQLKKEVDEEVQKRLEKREDSTDE